MLSALQDGGERSKVLLARLAEQPKSPAIIGVAELLCEQGHFGEAITRLRAMAELYDDSYRYHLVLARAYRDSGDFERAKRHYEKACQIAPQNEVAMKELIALAAFPQSLKKSAPSAPAPEAPTPTVSASQPSLPEVPSDFKLDREKLSRVLSGVVSDSSATKSPSATETTRDDIHAAPSSEVTPSPAVLEEFRKADALLEQPPDLDALALEAMGLSALPTPSATIAPSEPLVASSSERDAPPIEAPNATPSESPDARRGEPLSFEEELMQTQEKGGDLDAFIAEQPTAHRAQPTFQPSPPQQSPPASDEYDALAREIMKAQIPKVVETNDPTPVAEQRQPFSDDEEIKIPTRQLAKIFQSQGAYAKAIKVYEMLAEREPENASLYEILIEGLREKMQSESR
ncbi:MAG: tetratricopeptide repeat protein [Chloroherpetonaceae bacterium]|nr:tetratricopeptide repeat protein [Chloroherpetonaceae bacterium]